MTGVIIALVILVIILVIFGGAIVGIYNGLVRAKNRVEETLKQIDVRLQNRYDLLPDLIQAVEKATTTDENIQTKIAEVRTLGEKAKSQKLDSANAAQKAETEQALSSAIGGLQISVEAYPELRSQEAIQNFMDQNQKIEEMIAASRQIYNTTVREYNEKTEVFPSNIFAGMFNFNKAAYFEAKEEAKQDISPEWGGKMTTR